MWSRGSDLFFYIELFTMFLETTLHISTALRNLEIRFTGRAQAGDRKGTGRGQAGNRQGTGRATGRVSRQGAD